MIDGREIVALSMADFGETATVNATSLQVVACLSGDVVIDNGEMINIGPHALAAAADIAALELTTGNDGDTITIGGVEYTILALDPDGAGTVILRLLEVA